MEQIMEFVLQLSVIGITSYKRYERFSSTLSLFSSFILLPS